MYSARAIKSSSNPAQLVNEKSEGISLPSVPVLKPTTQLVGSPDDIKSDAHTSEPINPQSLNRHQETVFIGEEAVQTKRQPAELKPFQLKKHSSSIDNKASSGFVTHASTVYQLAPVANNRLNVIGEEHTKSEKNDEMEKAYLKEAAGGGGYWTESEFKVEKHPDQNHPKGAYGDPMWLHMEFQLNGIREALLICSSNPALLNQNLYGEVMYLWNSVMNFFENITSFFGNKYDLNAQQVSAVKAAVAIYVQAKSKIDLLTKAVSDQTSVTTAIVSNAERSISDLTKKIYLVGRPSTVVNSDREESMHQVANLEFDRKGAWKIGDTHAQNLNDPRKAANRKYNLVLQHEFETELAQFEKNQSGFKKFGLSMSQGMKNLGRDFIE